MALIDKASLLMVPSTYEAGKLYNVLPSGNRAPDSTDQNSGYDQTRADFDFDRGSNAAATRIDSNGVLQKYRENLLLRSNQFDTTWSNVRSSETSGQSGYDGTNNAWLLTTTGAGGRLDQSVSLSGVQSFSIYAKANTFDFLFLLGLGASDRRGNFDLANGVVTTTLNLIDSSIESIGNGWYRCSITYNDTISGVRVYGLQADNDFTGTSGSIYIQSAQVESGLVSTDYLNSTDVTAKSGVLVDLPRINYDANGNNGALLLEPSRQQLVQFSEYFGASYWDKINSSAVKDSSVSPDGSANSYLATISSGGFLRFGSSVTAGANYTLTCYVKKPLTGGATHIRLTSNNTSAWGTGISSKTELTNLWQRVVLSGVYISSGTNSYTMIGSKDENNANDSDCLGDVLIFGAMLEAGSYPTSYIPNHGTSGGVTRAADSCSVTGASDVIGQTEGTLYSEVVFLEEGNQSQWMSISDGTSQNWIFVGKDNDNIRGYIRASNSVIFTNQTFQIVDNAVAKIAIAYKSGDVALYINGTKISSSTNSFSFNNALDRINFTSSNSGTTIEKTRQKKILVFKERLNDAELATLTTL